MPELVEEFDQVDAMVMRLLPYGMIDGTLLTIEAISGFEKLNTRPYHRYETWCRGWRITDPRLARPIEREDLASAISAWIVALDKMNGEPDG
ncbi:MAG: hypothetical protein GY701_26835 [Sulfitobacter sp.]|nr:hypothetical protein [Sulfitobacter sp.]